MKSKKELTVKQVLFREFIQLLLIEGIVFGINYAFGNHYSAKLSIALSLSIALVYVLVYVILWLDDQRVARMFNEQLKQYQAEHSK